LELKNARADLTQAVNAAPNDALIRKAFDQLVQEERELKKHLKKYGEQQKSLFSGLVANLDKQNKKLSEKENEEKYKACQGMPALERVRII